MYGYYPQNMNPYTPQMPRQELIRVNGLEGAKAYQMSPNGVAALFDANEDILYIKSTDGAGFPNIRMFAFSEINPASAPTQEAVASESFAQINRTLNEIKEMIANGKQPVRKQQAVPSAE